MRVLHLIPSIDPRGGGPQEGLRQYCAQAARLGHEFEVASFDAPGAGCLADYPAAVHALGPHSTRYWYAPRAIPWLRAHLGEYSALVIHGLWGFHVYAGWKAAARSVTPYFVFPHGMLDPWFKRTYPLKHLKKWLVWPWAERRALRDATAVLFTAEEEERVSRDTFWFFRGRPEVVGFGIGEPPGDPASQVAAFYDRYPDLKDRRMILFLGRVHPKKGCDLAIEALSREAAREPDLHLVVAGPADPALQGALAAHADRLGVSRRITWTGMLTGDTKWGALRAAEAFILPSHQENFGVAPVEAMACATPVLISDKVNIWREIAADGAGYVAPDTVDGATSLLEQLLGLSGEERARMGRRGADCYRRRFSIERATRRLLDVLAVAAPPDRVTDVDPERHPA